MCFFYCLYTKKAEPVMRFELMTSSLPRKRSTPELHWRSLSGRRGSNPRPLAWKANALPTELLPLFSFLSGDSSVGLRLNLWEKMDSNHRRYKPADLQSAPFGHSGILPFFRFFRAIPSLDFVSSVSHCRKATPSLVTRPSRTHSEINFKNL